MVRLPIDLLRGNGRLLTNCGGVVEEISSVLWKRGKTESKKPTKGSRKVCEEFLKLLRSKNIISIKDF